MKARDLPFLCDGFESFLGGQGRLGRGMQSTGHKSGDGYLACAGIIGGVIGWGHGLYALGIQGVCACGGTSRINCCGGYVASAGFIGGLMG